MIFCENLLLLKVLANLSVIKVSDFEAVRVIRPEPREERESVLRTTLMSSSLPRPSDEGLGFTNGYHP
jgi:hypothetical protein